MFFVAVVSMSTSRVLHQFGIPQQILQNQLQFETENALKNARLLSTTRLETLQAFVLYLVCPRFLACLSSKRIRY